MVSWRISLSLVRRLGLAIVPGWEDMNPDFWVSSGPIEGSIEFGVSVTHAGKPYHSMVVIDAEMMSEAKFDVVECEVARAFYLLRDFLAEAGRSPRRG